MKDPIKLWLDICKRFAEQSKCQSRKVGCIIVSGDHQIGQGFNGAPRGSTCSSCKRCNMQPRPESGKDLDKAICAHAEANAIGNCARRGIATEGATIYCTNFCCLECAKLLVAAGIKEVVCFEDYSVNDQEISEVFRNAGIIIKRTDANYIDCVVRYSSDPLR